MNRMSEYYTMTLILTSKKNYIIFYYFSDSIIVTMDWRKRLGKVIMLLVFLFNVVFGKKKCFNVLNG